MSINLLNKFAHSLNRAFKTRNRKLAKKTFKTMVVLRKENLFNDDLNCLINNALTIMRG